MRRFITAALAAAALSAPLSTPAFAELEVGATAPDFTAPGYYAGEAVEFNLAAALATGPVVVFFFPAAFTSGCEAQAASFAESIEEFEALGATVIGVTGGNTDRLADFSTQHCASAFPVFEASSDIRSDYDVALTMRPGWTNRTTYVIGQDSTIALSYSEMSPYEHVDRSLAALREMQGL